MSHLRCDESLKNTLKYSILILLIHHISTQSIHLFNSPCCILYSESNFLGNRLVLNDQDQTVNLLDDYRLLGHVWNSTRSIKLEQGCQLEVCNSTYFDGRTELISTESSVPLWSDFQSAKCTCAKTCKCEDIFMSRHTCARAYQDENCHSCDGMYTEILQGESDMFPVHFKTKVKALRVRKGCSVRLFEDEKFHGDEVTISNETNGYFTGSIGSYICECDDNLYEPKLKPPRPPNYPVLIDIPKTMDDVYEMANTHGGHPGLTAAIKSLRQNRSSKNAYILLLGSTGSGKSSAINVLFANSNLTNVGGEKSTTTNIHEFRVRVPVDEIGVNNSELRVIDTPGFGDTRGIEFDACFLATLNRYLATHDELNDRLPNVVLIFHQFTDNRFDGAGSNFVKMLRSLDSFRERITDDKFSNVVFVLSHFASSSKSIQRHPEDRLARFKEVIKTNTLFPQPILISLAENHGRQEELPMVNGYYKMRNNELHPKNLFDKLEFITQNSKDAIGLAVFQTAFRDSLTERNKTVTTFPNINCDKSKESVYLQKLTDKIFNMNNTKVASLLQDAFRNMNTTLKSRYPDALYYLQKAFNLRNIFDENDIPRTTTEILKLVTSLENNEATVYLMENGLDLKGPTFRENVVGYGYDVFKDTSSISSPYDFSIFRLSPIGFEIPVGLKCSLGENVNSLFSLYKNKEEYISQRRLELNLEADSISTKNFIGDVKPGYNIPELWQRNDSTLLAATWDMALFEISCENGSNFSKEFIKIVKGLSPFNSSDHNSVETWTRFFSEYGTHIVHSVHGGGSIEIQLHIDKPFNNMTDKDFLTVAYTMFQILTNLNDTLNRTVLPIGFTQSLTFSGGDSKFHTDNLSKMSMEEARVLMDKWKKSLKYNPILLKNKVKLTPLHQVVRNLGHNYSVDMEHATRLLFNGSLKYEPKEFPVSTTSIFDTPIMLQMIELLQESQKKLRAVKKEVEQMELQVVQDKIEKENTHRELTNKNQLEKQNHEIYTRNILNHLQAESNRRQQDLLNVIYQMRNRG